MADQQGCLLQREAPRQCQPGEIAAARALFCFNGYGRGLGLVLTRSTLC